jgi:hypothetical protein
VSNDLVNNNHAEWTGCHLKEFERCQETCLWNQQKQLLVGEEYVPFDFPKFPGWVNCNLWDGDERPNSLGPLKDDRVIWRKETEEKDPTVTKYLKLNWVEKRIGPKEATLLPPIIKFPSQHIHAAGILMSLFVAVNATT